MSSPNKEQKSSNVNGNTNHNSINRVGGRSRFYVPSVLFDFRINTNGTENFVRHHHHQHQHQHQHQHTYHGQAQGELSSSLTQSDSTPVLTKALAILNEHNKATESYHHDIQRNTNFNSYTNRNTSINSNNSSSSSSSSTYFSRSLVPSTSTSTSTSTVSSKLKGEK